MKIDVVESELTNAAKLLDNFSNNITIFGVERINQERDSGKKAYQLSKLLSDNRFNILTGAGSGIMQVTNQGAFFLLDVSFCLPIITYFKTLAQQSYIS